MSYILEALKKAQAERQLGNAPTIHAPTLSAVPQEASGRKPLVIGFAAGAVLVAGALFAWRQQGAAPEKLADAGPANHYAAPAGAARASQAAAPAVPSVAPTTVAPASSAPGVPVAPPAPAKPASVESTAQVALVQDPPSGADSHESRQARVQPAPQKQAAKAAEPVAASSVAAARPAAPAPVAAIAPSRPAPHEVAPQAPAAARTASAVPAQPVAVPAAPPAGENLRTLNELPESIRFNIPRVTFGGYMYSPNPADSLVLIDRVLRREGEEVAPGLVLEKVLPKAAVMNYRGNRYRVPL